MEMSEWMQVMLEEIERKQAEEQAAREEQARRSESPDEAAAKLGQDTRTSSGKG